MSTITSLTTKSLKNQIRYHKDKSFRSAIVTPAARRLRKIIYELERGVINIYGTPGSGRTVVAKKLLYLLKDNYSINITMDDEIGYKYISKNAALLVMSGKIEETGSGTNKSYAENYQNYCLKRNGVAIIISTVPLDPKYCEFSIETVYEEYNGEEDDIISIRSLISISDEYLGYVNFEEVVDEDYNRMIDKKIDDAREDYLTDEVQTIINNIDKYTQQVINQFIIPEEVLFFNEGELRRRQNDIRPTFNVALGGPGSGKSTISEILLNQLCKVHGNKHVHAKSHKMDLGILLHRGFNTDPDKFIQFVKIEDATYELNDDPQVFALWINIRHLVNKATGGTEEDKSTGLQMGRVITWLNLHEFEGKACPKAYRQKVDNLWIMENPTNMHDRHLVKNFLEQGVYFAFIDHITKQKRDAEKRKDIEAMKYWSGWGVVRTREGIFPFRMHTDDYKPREFEIMNIHSTWRETWQTVEQYLIDKFDKMQLEKITSTIINAEINKFEFNEYGRIRPPNEWGVNYRKAIADNVKAYFEIVTQNPVTAYNNNNNNASVTQTRDTYKAGEYELELVDVEVDNEFLLNMIKWLPKSRKGMNDYQGVDDYLRHTVVLKSYWHNSQDIAATEEGVSQGAVTKWTRKYKQGYKHKKEIISQGYDAERVLLRILGDEWESAGSNSAGADLYNKKEKKLISLKFTGKSEYRNYLKRVGDKEIQLVKEEGWDGQLWIYIAPLKTWRKYKILTDNDEDLDENQDQE